MHNLCPREIKKSNCFCKFIYRNYITYTSYLIVTQAALRLIPVMLIWKCKEPPQYLNMRKNIVTTLEDHAPANRRTTVLQGFICHAIRKLLYKDHMCIQRYLLQLHVMAFYIHEQIHHIQAQFLLAPTTRSRRSGGKKRSMISKLKQIMHYRELQEPKLSFSPLYDVIWTTVVSFTEQGVF